MTTTGPITTSTGTDVYVTTREATRDRIVVLDNPAAPEDMRHCEAGRVIDGGFQPAPFAAWALRPEVLRAIADLIDPERADALQTLTRVEALIGRWESPGLVCECGHVLDQHNSNGCYERITYKPEVLVCDCPLTDDRCEDDFAIRDLRTALHPEETP